MKCDNCQKAGIIKGFDACNDCTADIDRNDYSEPKYADCNICGCNMPTHKMVKDWNGYICPECDDQDKRRTP